VSGFLAVVGVLAIAVVVVAVLALAYTKWTERLLRSVNNGLATVRVKHEALETNVKNLAPERRTGWYYDQFVRAADAEVVEALRLRIEALENPKDIKSNTKKGDKK